ncbi:hypothetical protein RND81_13G123300 [Saponaria officinalis]|uniref:Zinc finger, CCHC-type n=1 Tax=Saponaria officinalis TaxID=3572 RepID=A0AAW1H2J3_SAPOF
MTYKFGKLKKFDGVDFRRWQKKMHFLLTTLKVVYVLSTPRPEERDDETLEETRKRNKWENDDYICRGHILNGQFTQHKMEIDESISVSSIIDKLPPSWKDFKHMLKHKKEELSLIQLGGHLRIEESLRDQEGNKPKIKETKGSSSINMMEEGESLMRNKGKKRPFENTKNGPNKRPKGSRNEVGFQYPYCFHVDDDPKTYDEAIMSQDASFWKEAVNDEMDSIIGNNTWILKDLPRGCKP